MTEATPLCDLTPPITTVLPISARAVVQSRTLLWTYGCPQHNEGVLDEAELMLWELVTSAVDHGTPPLLLKIECRAPGGGLQVLVGEGRDDDAAVPGSGEPLAGWGGRGIALVDLLSAAWGVHDDAETTAVWFRMGPGSTPRRNGG